MTFGEAMLRLSPPGRRRLEQADVLEVWPAGAELNVAVGLARLGTPAAWVSRLPRNPLGRLVAAHARAHGVDTNGVVWDDDGRLGLYFVEVADPPRRSSGLYDRTGSSFAQLDTGDFDWSRLLAGARAFHVTAITPALSESCARAAEQALTAARGAGCVTLYDLNFRARLTTPAAARTTAERLAGSVDVLVASAVDAAHVFALDGDAAELAAELRGRLGIEHVVVSARMQNDDGTQQRVSVSVADETHTVTSPAFGTVDPVGGGDAFCAGFLHGLLSGDARRGLELGGAAAALKQSVPGDFPVLDAEEVEELVASPGTIAMRR